MPLSKAIASSDAVARDLAARGFRVFRAAASKGHDFVVWLKPPATEGRTAWKAAVVSRGTVNFATAYVADGILRASVLIADPAGHLLFRAETLAGRPMSNEAFQCKFGSAR